MNTPDTLIQQQPCFNKLESHIQAFLVERSKQLRLSVQDCRQTSEIALDLQMWGGPSIIEQWPDESRFSATGKARKQQILAQLRTNWDMQKSALNQYPENSTATKISAAAEPSSIDKQDLGLGRCPVASPRTLCCNLQTLDAVDNCGYGCSYCSIQSFFDGKKISFDRGFAEKLKNLELDPQQTYHIGTGQSSDSLMWGNSHGVLDAEIAFAAEHPNVILELKTKSANVSHLLSAKPTKNIICTWSLNTPTIIEHEEHGTATLDKRLQAARKMADAGYLVGFHFHPMVHYQNWQQDYVAVVENLSESFSADEVALVSIGTLTYIKPVITEIRKRAIPSQILKMPMVDAAGKRSYPDEIKLEMFSSLYQAFPQDWKDSVFFYLCMENAELWEPVFGRRFDSNAAFEQAMKSSYLDKINIRR